MPRANAIHRDSARKLQHILSCATRVFFDKGYEGASIRDISRASRVSLSGLYYYFQSKQQLLYLIQSYTFTSIVQQLEEKLAGVTDPEERLRILVQNHLDYFLQHPLEMKVLSHEDEALEDPYRKEVAEIKRRYYSIGRGIVEELQRTGRAKKLNPRVAPRVAMMSLFGMMNWIYTWHRPKVDPRAGDLADIMAGIFLEGISGSNGNGSARNIRAAS